MHIPTHRYIYAIKNKSLISRVRKGAVYVAQWESGCLPIGYKALGSAPSTAVTHKEVIPIHALNIQPPEMLHSVGKYTLNACVLWALNSGGQGGSRPKEAAG